MSAEADPRRCGQGDAELDQHARNCQQVRHPHAPWSASSQVSNERQELPHAPDDDVCAPPCRTSAFVMPVAKRPRSPWRPADRGVLAARDRLATNWVVSSTASGRRLPSSPLGSSAVGSSERSLLTNAIVGRQAAFAEPGAEFGEKRHASECTTASPWAVLGAEARPLRLARRANRICAGSLREPCAAAKLGLLATACAPNWFLGSRPACLVVRALR